MECTTWSEKDWKTLLHTIRQKNCLLLLGPDAALESDDDGARPLTEVLAQELSGKLRAEVRAQIDCSNLAQVTQYYRLEAAGRNDLEAEIDAFYAQRQELSSELHDNLAALPFYFFLTSTPDRMLCNALKKAGKNPKTAYYHFQGEKHDMAPAGAAESPLIFHLYGSLENPASLVLTENDLLDFLVAVIAKTPDLPHNVRSELRDPHKSLLFLGFGFKHWYLRILLRVLEEGQRKDSRSFALEQCVPVNIDEFQRTIMFFSKSDYQITICAQELRSFVRELHARYTACPAVSAPEVDLAGAPTVFVCHAKQNRAEAENLCDRLKAAGFNAWFDEKNLRGGDEWDRTIERAIAKEIEYFVVLQSQAMAAKYESYFHKEIRLALERQNYFRPGIRFIIPTKIDDCSLLEELEHLQTIDVSEKGNVEKLISDIKRDQQRRNRK